MNEEQQLKLQAFFDGELPQDEARQVANWIARDGEASALLAELRNTRQALGGYEQDVKLPESRAFYWSRIERRIERLETPAPQPAGPRVSILDLLLRRFLVPAGALAAMVIAGLIATNQFRDGSPIMEKETELAEAGAFTYHDYSSGTTLVWLSYPAENEFAVASALDTIR